MAALELESRRLFARELQAIEVALMQLAASDPSWLAPHDEAALRWALSLARLSEVVVPAPGPEGGGRQDVVELGRAGDKYRQQLHERLAPICEPRLDRHAVRAQIPRLRELARDERQNLLRLFGGRLPASALDRATRRRPLAVACSGGGGTAYVFVGAMDVLAEAGLEPDCIAATSMGAILAAFRARTRAFELKAVKALMTRVTWRKVFRMFDTTSRFGLPATLKLYLREVLGGEFLNDEGGFLRLKDLTIPFRVCVSGIAQGQGPKDVDAYAHLLDDAVEDVRNLRKRAGAIMRALSDITRQPLRPIYLGGDELTEDFDVLDAIGFSAAVPGVIHYDIIRDDPRMVELVSELMRRENLFRLVDCGLSDNMPVREAWRCAQSAAIGQRDPFVLALDSFAPRLDRHLLFLPLMRIAAETTRQSRALAHLTVTYKGVLSPLSVVPTQSEFLRAIDNGRRETVGHVPLIRKMVGPIPDPPGIVTELA